MKTIAPIVAILAIVGLELYAISHGINGATLAIVVGVIAGLGGYVAPHKTPKP